MLIIKCTECGWVGDEKTVSKLLTDATDENGKFIDHDQCPNCGSILHLTYGLNRIKTH